MNCKKSYQALTVTVLFIADDCITASYQLEGVGDVFDFNGWNN